MKVPCQGRHLALSNIRREVELPVQIAWLHRVLVYEDKTGKTGPGQHEGHIGAYAAKTGYAQAQFLEPAQPVLGDIAPQALSQQCGHAPFLTVVVVGSSQSLSTTWKPWFCRSCSMVCMSRLSVMSNCGGVSV